MDALLEGLNDAQKSAVTSPANVVQVLAPPGSGKTKTLTARVAYHINHERIQPWNIIVCTFTIKAAREMKERIKGFVGEKLESKLILGTFHSVAIRFLSRYGQEIGIGKNFCIADTNDSTAILKRIVKRFEYTVEPGHARMRISKLKARGITEDHFWKTCKKADDNEFATVYSSYQEHLKAHNLLDYDDLLVRCVELLRRSPSCVSTIRAVLIDEYQDTNNIQYELMQLLAQQLRRITVVGDPDQSIYSFRSAEIGNLTRMREDYPESIVINLENNYRSSGRILESALVVIEQDEHRPQKPLVATLGVGEQPTLRHLVSAGVEAKWIVEEIHRTKSLTAGLLGYNDYAILLRSANLSLQIERALGQAGVPYRMQAGIKFFDRAEIKIILDYLRVVSQPEHNDAVARVINLPSRGVGDTTVKLLLEEAEANKITLWKMVVDVAQGRRKPKSKVSTQAQKGIEQFFGIIRSARAKLDITEGEHCNLFDLIKHVLDKIAYQSYLKQAHKDNWQDRWANVEELIAQATQMATAFSNGEEIGNDTLPIVEGIEQRPDTAGDILSKFLANVTLSSVADQEGGDHEQVTISTIHAAKGLEWPVVFIPAVYDGSIPHSRADDHDEERRLLYVGMTRAQGLLYLSCPVKQVNQEETTLSKFVSDRKIHKYFSERGPDLAFRRSTIPDLAAILRRPCPSTVDLQTAHGLLERLEDDKYPATREGIDGDDASWGAPWDSNSNRSNASALGTSATHPSSKRRKLESSTSFSTDSVSVTMHKSTSFSTVSTTMHTLKAGFTSARDLQTQQALQQEAERIRMLVSAQDVQAGKSAYTEARKADTKPGTARAKAIKPRATGQGAITAFFRKPETALAGETLKQHKLSTNPSFQRSSSLPSTSTPLQDISNVTPPTQPSHTYTHKLQTGPLLSSKPKRQDTTESTRYVLLSSSPVKPDVDADLDGVSSVSVEQEPESPVRMSGFRPATTLHATSMGQLQAQAHGQRKTLGTRRTMQGWSVKRSGMPKPRGG